LWLKSAFYLPRRTLSKFVRISHSRNTRQKGRPPPPTHPLIRIASESRRLPLVAKQLAYKTILTREDLELLKQLPPVSADALPAALTGRKFVPCDRLRMRLATR
jgi:hypothetical protein